MLINTAEIWFARIIMVDMNLACRKLSVGYFLDNIAGRGGNAHLTCIVVSDVRIPVMNGFQHVRALRISPRHESCDYERV